MKIYTFEQGAPEWHEVRNRNFTASELGPFALEPVRITLSVEKIKEWLDAFSIPRKGITKRDELLAMLPNPEEHAELSDAARTAIIKKIVAGAPKDEWQIAMDEKMQRDFGFNIPVQRGNTLEPLARAEYERMTGHRVSEFGFIEHDSGGFGCSPDGIIITSGEWSHGLEIKCPMPETHIGWLLDGVLPECHALQCHAGMAASGLDRWDFFSFCPGDAPLLVEVYRDETTERLEAGLKTMVKEKAKILQTLKTKMEAIP